MSPQSPPGPAPSFPPPSSWHQPASSPQLQIDHRQTAPLKDRRPGVGVRSHTDEILHRGTSAQQQALASGRLNSARLTSFLRNPPTSHTHVPPSLAGSLLLESHHSPFHRRTLSQKGPSRRSAPNDRTMSGQETPEEEYSPAHGRYSSDRSLSPTQSTSRSGSIDSTHSTSGSSSGSSSDPSSTSSSCEEDADQPASSGVRQSREYFPEDILLSPWLTPKQFSGTTPRITRREMEARLGNMEMEDYFDQGEG